MNNIAKIFIVLFGILLPAATLAVEMSTGMSGSEYFDPIPTIWHLLAVAFVPVANGLVFYFALRSAKIPPYISGYLSACALFISLLYTIPYLPLMPIAFPAVLLYGIGFLPLSPSLALLSAVMLRRALKKRNVINAKQRVPGLLPAAATVTAIFLVLEFQPLLTTAGLKLANSSNPTTSQRGIDILRSVGSEETMLGACYGRRGRAMDPLSMMFGWTATTPLSNDDARNIFFRVTGRTYSSLPLPPSVRQTNFARWSFDFDQGTRNVGNINDEIQLTTSNFAGSVDAVAAVGYTEWTLNFRNSSFVQQEARTQIALPPGAVVSRLTLWINGEEREAAFAGRGTVERAYQQVVSQRRDPVLVTTDGPDRILLQLFPIPPNGGNMKVRVGFTAPLELDVNGKPMYFLPNFIERNFAINDSLRHDLWVDAEASSTAVGWQLVANKSKEGKFSVKGGLTTADLGKGSIVYDTQPGSKTSYTADYRSAALEQIVQRFERVPAAKPTALLAVIDASAPVAAHRESIEGALRQAKGVANLSIYLATDSAGNKLIGPKVIPASSKDFHEELTNALEAAPYTGGQDDTPALIRAIDDAQDKSGSVIMWFHGAQYLQSPEQENFNQRLLRANTLPTIFDVELERGKNAITQSLERQQILERVPTESAALTKFVANLLSSESRNALVRQKVPVGETPTTSDSHKTSAHLAKLWAADEVKRLIRFKVGDLKAATLLAAAYNIVTPVTGAVVLETQAQYDAAGLNPANPMEPNTVPTIPEPETYLLMIVGGSFLLFAFKKQKEGVCHGHR